MMQDIQTKSEHIMDVEIMRDANGNITAIKAVNDFKLDPAKLEEFRQQWKSLLAGAGANMPILPIENVEFAKSLEGFLSMRRIYEKPNALDAYKQLIKNGNFSSKLKKRVSPNIYRLIVAESINSFANGNNRLTFSEHKKGHVFVNMNFSSNPYDIIGELIGLYADKKKIKIKVIFYKNAPKGYHLLTPCLSGFKIDSHISVVSIGMCSMGNHFYHNLIINQMHKRGYRHFR